MISTGTIRPEFLLFLITGWEVPNECRHPGHRRTAGPPRRAAAPPAPGPRPRPADPGRQGRRLRKGAAPPRGRAWLQPVDLAAGAARARPPRLAGDPVAGRLGQPDGAAAPAPRARTPPRRPPAPQGRGGEIAADATVDTPVIEVRLWDQRV